MGVWRNMPYQSKIQQKNIAWFLPRPKSDRLLKPFGLLIVYHKYVMPNPDPTKYFVLKRVFIGNRTYHLPRAAIYFQKVKLI